MIVPGVAVTILISVLYTPPHSSPAWDMYGEFSLRSMPDGVALQLSSTYGLPTPSTDHLPPPSGLCRCCRRRCRRRVKELRRDLVQRGSESVKLLGN